MKIFYDTEFIEDGRTIELISIGMVAEDGREYYAVNWDLDPSEVASNEWLRTNVLPTLPAYEVGQRWYWDTVNCTTNGLRTRRQLRDEVRAFIGHTPNAELWAWYGAYDHVVLAQLFGRMIDLPEGVPMWTNDLKQEVVRLGNPELRKQEGAEHNALADARWVRDCWSLLSS